MKLLNKTPKESFYIIIIIVLLIAQPLYYKTHNKVSAYKIERATKDLSLVIEDLNLISMNKGIYIEPGWILRTGSNNKDTIENISLTISTGKDTIFPINFPGGINTPSTTIHKEGTPFFISGIRINDDSVINISITYMINGAQKEYSEDLELKSFTKQIFNFNKNMDKY